MMDPDAAIDAIEHAWRAWVTAMVVLLSIAAVSSALNAIRIAPADTFKATCPPLTPDGIPYGPVCT
jgi:hypothetical protein